MKQGLVLAFLVLSCLSLVPLQGKVYRGSIDFIELTEPPLRYSDINAVWEMLKEEVGAPGDFPPPPLVLDWEVPHKARMGFQYPTVNYPQYPLMVSIAPRTIDTWHHELVTYGVGHELLHYLFLLRDNGFDLEKRTFDEASPHHCNREFMRISRLIADRIWDMYHSTEHRSVMYDEVTKSCFNQPGQ